MKILLTGASGQIGQKLGPKLRAEGFDVICVTRNIEKNRALLFFASDFIEIDLVESTIPKESLKNIDVIIHLMGESIDGYWTEQRKKRIYDSRIKSSRNLVKSLESFVNAENKPFVISASAQGIYGNCDDRIVNESDVPENASPDFLAKVCKDWERPFQDLANTGVVRAVQLRFPMILDPDFGALKKLIELFNNYLGAVLGNGQQWMSWAACEDIIAIIMFMIKHNKTSGAYNCNSPGVMTNRDFTQTLASHLGVFTLPAVPRLILKILFGEMSSLFLNSARMSSDHLVKAGFHFQYTDLRTYLQKVVKKH